MEKAIRCTLKKTLAFLLTVSMVLIWPISVSATEPLGAHDNVFQVKMYSAEADGEFDGHFFKKDNTLYVAGETLVNMAPLVKYTDKDGKVTGFARRDLDDASFESGDKVFTFDGVDYYPFVDAMTDLAISVTYDREKDIARVIPAKYIWGIEEALRKIYANRVYDMEDWQFAQVYDAKTSRVTAQAVDIARNLFSLPATVVGYVSGDTEMEQYRDALWKVMLPNVEIDLSESKLFNEEEQLTMAIFGVGAEHIVENSDPILKELMPNFYGGNGFMGTALSVYGDMEKVLQIEDVCNVTGYFYNLENIDASVSNGINLVYATGVQNNANLNAAFEEVIKITSDETSLWESIIKESGDGVIEFLLGKTPSGKLNNDLGETAVKVLDKYGKELFGENYNAAQQIEAIIVATSNLEIQNSARRSYNYYKNIFYDTEDINKRTDAIKNMKDISLVYLFAGHNAWKSMENQEGLSGGAKAAIDEILKHIDYLLAFDETDFSVYENAMDTKHAIMARCENREQTYYFFTWDEKKADAVGGLDFSIEGKDENGASFLCKKIFSYLYYKRNGLLVGNIRSNNRTDGYSRTVETYALSDAIGEIVIRPKKARSSVADINMQVAVGFPTNVWSEGLEQYLVRQSDGSEIYRIPLPLGSGVSQGEALYTARVEPAFEFMQTSAEDNRGQSDSVQFVKVDYVPSGPFNAEFLSEISSSLYKIKYNEEVLFMYGLSGPDDLKIGYASQKGTGPWDYVSQGLFVNKTFDSFHESKVKQYGDESRYYNVQIGDVKKIKAGNAEITYFFVDFDVHGGQGFPGYFYYVDMGTDIYIEGNWSVMDYEGLQSKVFEHFLLDAFSNIEISPIEK